GLQAAGRTAAPAARAPARLVLRRLLFILDSLGSRRTSLFAAAARLRAVAEDRLGPIGKTHRDAMDGVCVAVGARPAPALLLRLPPRRRRGVARVALPPLPARAGRLGDGASGGRGDVRAVAAEPRGSSPCPRRRPHRRRRADARAPARFVRNHVLRRDLPRPRLAALAQRRD